VSLPAKRGAASIDALDYHARMASPRPAYRAPNVTLLLVLLLGVVAAIVYLSRKAAAPSPPNASSATPASSP